MSDQSAYFYESKNKLGPLIDFLPSGYYLVWVKNAKSTGDVKQQLEDQNYHVGGRIRLVWPENTSGASVPERPYSICFDMENYDTVFKYSRGGDVVFFIDGPNVDVFKKISAAAMKAGIETMSVLRINTDKANDV